MNKQDNLDVIIKSLWILKVGLESVEIFSRIYRIFKDHNNLDKQYIEYFDKTLKELDKTIAVTPKSSKKYQLILRRDELACFLRGVR